MTVCAYCQQDRPPTREHVIPAFIYDFQKQLEGAVAGWNEVAQRMVGGEGKVKDVCAACNNQVLGQLDAYGKEMLRDAGLLVHNYTKCELTLEYDYAFMLRWLLKMSFNSSRTDGVHSALFERYVPFIRGLGPVPSRSQVSVLLYLARPEVLSDSRLAEESLFRITNGSAMLNPFLARICYGGIPGEQRYVLRLNIFGPAVFYIVMFKDGILPGDAASAIRSLKKSLQAQLN